jgi:transposase
MKSIQGEVFLAHGHQPRRRFAPAEKVAMVEESFAPGMSASATARKYGVSPSQIFQWRKLMKDGEIKAVASEENVVPESEVKALKQRIKELERALGKKTFEVDTLKELIEVAREKKLILSSQLFKKDESK